MINFRIFTSKNLDGGDLNMIPLSLNEYTTIFDLKLNMVSILDMDLNDFSIILENYGILDNPDSLDLPLCVLGLEAKDSKSYCIFIHNLKNPAEIWKNSCTKTILDDKFINQIGFVVKNNIPICYACKLFCRQNEPVKEVLLENSFSCMCHNIHNKFSNDKRCLFLDMQIDYKTNKQLVLQNINSILTFHAEQVNKKEQAKIQVVNKKALDRVFDFERSTKFGLQRVQMYEMQNVKEKVFSSIPISKLEEETKEKINGCKSNLAFKDEFVKSLLNWFKNGFFTWCNKPACVNCKKPCENYVDSSQPNEEERKWLASRTEVYKCGGCGGVERFPRYNNPAKLCDTKTGRCGEWANLFGCVLRSQGYDVRFIDNFEDHVWNEYWSESLNRWVHVDSCENAWDTPLIYEQGWGRSMTYILAYSIDGVFDVTRRYIKDWNIIASRRKQSDIDNLRKLIEFFNNSTRQNYSPERIEYLANRDLIEQVELLKLKDVKEAEMIGRQSGSEDWRKERGEIK